MCSQQPAWTILRSVTALLLSAGFFGMSCPGAAAETLEAALAYAYRNNPQLEAQRAQLRAIDENVPEALSGYRPQASIAAAVGPQTTSTTTREISSTTPPGAPATYFIQSGENVPRSYGLTVTQNVFNGFQTANKTRVAETQVQAGREVLRATEQVVLLGVVTAYMNVLRDGALLDLQRRNSGVLADILRQTRTRLQAGAVTATDVSQAEARLNAANIQVSNSEAAYVSSQAIYKQVVGLEPANLAPASTADRLLPASLVIAVNWAGTNHPTVTTAQYNADAAALQVKVSEGVLYPTFNIVATLQQSYETTLIELQSWAGAVGGQVTIPLYQGGGEYAQIRQAKETQGQQMIQVAVIRDQARAGARLAWAQAEAAKRNMESARAEVNSAEAALNGVQEEARLGQRTTYDVLNAEQDVLNAQIAVVTTEHDRVVDSYTLLAAVGGLSVQALGLKVPVYDPGVHYHQVRDAWAGIRTPDGK